MERMRASGRLGRSPRSGSPSTPTGGRKRCRQGQRERVALARAFATQPSIVIADEPTARLDAAATVLVGTLLRDLAHDAGATVVCATHDPLVVDLADEEVRLGRLGSAQGGDPSSGSLPSLPSARWPR